MKIGNFVAVEASVAAFEHVIDKATVVAVLVVTVLIVQPDVVELIRVALPIVGDALVETLHPLIALSELLYALLYYNFPCKK